MASTNVEYYEKQKELQDQINKSEQERLRLDQQLKAYFQSDQRLGKLKAVRLHNYWKKICEDERRSKQRNEQIRKEFERIDAHMASLGSRTDRLRLLKKQYEEYIERTYPQWKEICQAKMSGQMAQPSPGGASEAAGESTSPREKSDPVADKVKLQMAQIKNTKPPTNVLNIRAVPSHAQPGPTSSAPQTYSSSQQAYTTSQQSYSTHQENMSSQQAYTASHPPQASSDPGGSAHHTYVNTQVQQAPAAYTSPSTVHTYDNIDGGIQTEYGRMDRDHNLTGRGAAVETPRDVSRVSNTLSDTPRDRSEDAGPLPVQNISIQKKTVSPAANAAVSQPPVTTTVPAMQPDDDEDVSDFGSDVELPLSDAQGQGTVKERQRTVSGGDNSREDSISASRTFTRGSSFQSSKRWSEYGCVKPELTLDGLMFLLKVVQEDFPHAFATDGYYRSYRPDSAARLDIISKANTKADLSSFDPNQVSMVILEQLLLVVRSLKDGCLVSDAMLDENAAVLTQDNIKKRLSLDAQLLWEGLFNHFALLLHHKVMEPKEMAAIFVPCIVEDGSLKQDKAYQLIVRLLAMMNGDDTDDASSHASPVRQQVKKTQDGAVNSETFDGKVPPLKFGSLLDKPLTDDESTSMFSSAPKEKMPLNETDAYKNMLTGTMNSQPSRHHDDEDTDDDVEKQFASVLSPRTPVSNSIPPTVANFEPQSKPPQIDDEEVSEMSSPTGAGSPVYVPTAMQQRSTMNSTGSNQPSNRIAGIKISSDLDSDSDLDVLKAGKKRQQSEDLDDFDFYG